MTTSTRKGWQSHGSHAHVQTAMLVIAVVDNSLSKYLYICISGTPAQPYCHKG